LIETIGATGSTSGDLAARLARGQPVPEGAWLVADRQTAGRGRLGRIWIDGAGNFMGSTVVHRRPGDPPAETLALVAGLALHEVLAPKVAATLKWPNDVLVGGAKLAGVLLERIGDAVIVGIGVNIAHSPDVSDRKTVSLADFGIQITRDAFAAELATGFGDELIRWRNFGLGPIVSRWETAAHPRGTALAVDGPGASRVTGTFAGLSETGSLQLRLADGSTRVIHSGEVWIV
jgi:BirA family biotin operon repressor/biotin-[acetyl-CoA-carboxylase] ligase